VPYDRAGEPEAVIVSARSPAGERALARSSDPQLVSSFVHEDPLGCELSLPLGC
jgi:acetyl-CoA C-acetyltransferase